MLTKIQAIQNLQELDHAFLSPEGVKELGKPFNIYQTTKLKDNRSDFKGLNCPGFKEGDLVEGLSSVSLAELICRKEKVEYPYMHGIGSQLRICCELLLKHFNK